MQHSKKPHHQWQDALKIISRCPICSETYQMESVRILAKTDTAHLVHITCGHCQGYFMAMILIMGSGLSSVGMVTDLSFEDVDRLRKTATITTDEIIAGYQQMQEGPFINSLSLNHQ